LIKACALIYRSQTSVQYPTFTYGLYVTSSVSLILRVASPLPVPLSVRGLIKPIHAYLESLTISTDYRKVKIALPALPNPLTRLLCRARYLCAFTGGLYVRESLSSMPAYSIIACTKPPLPICYLSFTLTLQHNHFDLLLPSAHLLGEPHLKTSLVFRGF